MAAGLVRYKLCDRDFDCENCPLDAALRGRPHPDGSERRSPDRWMLPALPLTFPRDRRYSTGHLWLGDDRGAGQGVASGRSPGWRMGLDAFAAGLLRSCGVRGLRPLPPGTSLAPGEPCCELELEAGTLPLAAPFAACLEGVNPALTGEGGDGCPGILGDPYGEGWLARLHGAGAGEGHLLEAPEAERQADLDLRRFRRLAGLQLLSQAASLGPCIQDGGAPVSDLRQMLGERRWLALLRQLVH